MKRFFLLGFLLLTISAQPSHATRDRDFWYRMSAIGVGFLTLVAEIPYFISAVESSKIAADASTPEQKASAERIFELSTSNAALNAVPAAIATSLVLRNCLHKSYPLRSEHPRTWKTLAFFEPFMLGTLAALSGFTGWAGAEIYGLQGVSSHSLQVCTSLWIPQIALTGAATLMSMVTVRMGWKLARPKVVTST